MVAYGVAVARILQPYRVAGRKAPAPTHQLDTAWLTVVSALTSGSIDSDVGTKLAGVPLVVGGRSSGARVACRTGRDAGAVGVVALAFPLHPPGRPERSRVAELDTGLPTLVVNGSRDAFGIPEAGPDRVVRVVPGEDHSLRRQSAAVAATVVEWLADHGWIDTSGSTEGDGK